MSCSPLFHRSEILLGAEALRRLGDTRVILFGVGGVGSWCAEALVRSGVGHLTIVDSDLICVTNVNRQLQATARNVGAVKVHELAARLLQINPEADIQSRQEIYDQTTKERFDIAAYDYVIDAIDSLSAKLNLIEYSLALKRTLFSAMGAACKLDPTRIRVSSIWKTTYCPLARRVRKSLSHHGITDDFLCVWSDEMVPNHATVATACGTAACLCPRYLPAEGGLAPAHEWCSSKAVINGAMVHITATYGMFLCGLVVNDVLAKAPPLGDEPCPS